MIIAYLLGKCSEGEEGFDWIRIIEGGLFEFLQRIVLTDLKPPVFYKIKEDRGKYVQLNAWVYGKLEPIISPLGEGFCERFRNHFAEGAENLNGRILEAAHFHATKWEFDIIERADPHGYEIETIRSRLEELQSRFEDLRGIRLLKEHALYGNFIDLCGQLRFQLRWSNIHRIPKTSVLGHQLFVAMLAYLFSLEIGGCARRRVNNYFTGLFHDLPEVLTRDIISPVKRSVEGLDELIKDYEREMMEREVYRLLPPEWHPEMRMFTDNEFESIVYLQGKATPVSSREIGEKYNEDRFSPKDGEIVKAVDRLAAFVEAHVATRNGSAAPELHEAMWLMRSQDSQTSVGGISLKEIYADFD
jgi:putative hydrolase of HD superfamily